METLKHENYKELMEFVASAYKEYIQPGSELKRMFRILGSPVPNALQQCMMEVRQQDGGFGMSHMSAKDWFNNDFIMRQQWADEISSLYALYTEEKKAEVEEVVANPVADELKALKEQVATLAARLAEAEEEMPMKKKKAPADEEESDAEDAAETPADEEAEGEDAKSKKGE